MANDNYKIFLSSRMEEFKTERSQIRDALADFFNTFVYEVDAGAKSQSIHDTYTKELLRSDLYIGIFGTGYGEFTIDEFDKAREHNIPCLIYEKELTATDKRDPQLVDFLHGITQVEDKNGLSTCWFSSSDDLIRRIKEDLKRWIKSQDKSETLAPNNSSPKLDMGLKYYCNRDSQAIDFFNKDKDEKFNFFIIDGEKKQSHTSLVKRFSLDKIALDNVKNTIAINDKGNIERLKIFIQMQLFSRFNIKPLPRDLSFSHLVERILPDNYGKVFVVFRIEEDLLSNKNISEVIQWFSKEYCKPENLPDGTPDFYFFLSIRYNETGASMKQTIKKQLNKLDTYVKLDELINVDPDDIKLWLEANGIAESESEQDAILGHYFKESTFPMELAEKHISKLIFDFNNKNQELMQLMHKY